MKKIIQLGALVCAFSMAACAHSSKGNVDASEAVRLDRELVKESVVFESGAKDGAVVPDISAPRLRAIWIPEHVEGNRLIEAHREWMLEGDVSILGTPQPVSTPWGTKK